MKIFYNMVFSVIAVFGEGGQNTPDKLGKKLYEILNSFVVFQRRITQHVGYPKLHFLP